MSHSATERHVCGVISNWTGRQVFCRTIVCAPFQGPSRHDVREPQSNDVAAPELVALRRRCSAARLAGSWEAPLFRSEPQPMAKGLVAALGGKRIQPANSWLDPATLTVDSAQGPMQNCALTVEVTIWMARSYEKGIPGPATQSGFGSECNIACRGRVALCFD